eukprot:CAMPEP_0174735782 /NCGR_PEP_ID=MMETSP1094-20130205/65551_1 /TAXON_ID=156173 /ORGANISM="Chrysochromulina brevifilum, Strain UTEX LB 985" /LENGTH=65 /DNA_ID=CAMNT_0015938783 /DNA_START=363 /DNA_END=560 /DNA_ORIENTATION=+
MASVFADKEGRGFAVLEVVGMQVLKLLCWDHFIHFASDYQDIVDGRILKQLQVALPPRVRCAIHA